MAKLNYQYQGGNSRRPMRESSGKFRLPLIFAVIALLTAGIIYIILPDSSEVPAGENVPAAEDRENGSEKTPEGSVDEEKPAGTPAEKEEKISEDPPEQPVAADEKKITETPQKEDGKEDEKEDRLLQPSDFPEKGKPWKNDPPEEAPVMPESGENSAQWRAMAQELTAKHLRLLRESADIPGFTIRHKVRSGESFSRISAKNDTTYDMIKLLSGFAADHNPNRLNVGQNLRLLPGPWHIVVEKGAKLLKLYSLHSGKEELFAVWEIGIGRQNTTPEGEFVVFDRLVKPAWTAPDGSVVSFGSPENPLGTRFLKLAKKESPKKPAGGFGIHGTNDDSSVTRSLSSGCIRMRNTDIEILFSIVPARSRVTVKE